jgi:flavin-dependent dehydrogenase
LVANAVRAGAELRERAQVTDLLREAGRVTGVRVEGATPAEILAPLVIGADGAYSAVARALGMEQLDESHYCAGLRAYYEGVSGFHPLNHVELHFVDEAIPGYFWIFPMANGRANVGVGMLSRVVKRKGIRLRALLDALIAHPRFRDRFAAARRVSPVRGWGLPLGSRIRTLAGDGWMLVGDAGSLIDPFTGEGIGNAMVSAECAARYAEEAHARGRFDGSFLADYERELRTYLSSELRLSHMMQRLLNWKWLVNAIIGKASRSEELAGAISGMFDSEEERQKLVSPLFYLKALAR